MKGKYRIVDVSLEGATPVYMVQARWLFFWVNCNDGSYGDGWLTSDLTEAKKYVDNMRWGYKVDPPRVVSIRSHPPKEVLYVYD